MMKQVEKTVQIASQKKKAKLSLTQSIGKDKLMKMGLALSATVTPKKKRQNSLSSSTPERIMQRSRSDMKTQNSVIKSKRSLSNFKIKENDEIQHI